MNIFAEVLVEVLAEHGKELGSLYSMTDNQEIINQNKVGLLKKSLDAESDQSAVLSVWELDVMRAYFRKTPPTPSQLPQPITDDQDRRIKTAIFAEGIRRLVWERFKSEAEHSGLTSIEAARATAYQIGRLVYNLFLTIKDPDGLRQVNAVLDTLRGVLPAQHPSPTPDFPATNTPDAVSSVDTLAPPLTMGVEIFMQGSLWLDAASEACEREQQRTLAAYAVALLERAQKFTNDALPSGQQAAYWFKEIARALEDAQDLI